MKTLEAKYEEQKIVHNERTKKQNEELEDLTNILNEVKVSLNERISKYGEEGDTKSPTESVDYIKNHGDNPTSLRISSDHLDSDAFSSCSTLTLDREDENFSKEDFFHPE